MSLRVNHVGSTQKRYKRTGKFFSLKGYNEGFSSYCDLLTFKFHRNDQGLIGYQMVKRRRVRTEEGRNQDNNPISISQKGSTNEKSNNYLYHSN